MQWKGALIRALAALAVIVLAAQVVPVERTNPPVTQEVPADEAVKGILRRACYDCHSNETAWPWYSRVAPMSWLVAKDVREGREHLNFSQWDQYTPQEQRHLIEECVGEIDEGEMPLWFYLPLHPEAKLSAQDLATLREWTGTMVATPGLRDEHGDDGDARQERDARR